ncbi:MAG: hypothetical protein U1F77_10850 [Kiritimatiellia bacterium]
MGAWARAEVYRDPVLTNSSPPRWPTIKMFASPPRAWRRPSARAGVQRAALFPSVNGTAGYSKARAGNIPPPLPGAESEQYNLSGRLSTSWTSGGPGAPPERVGPRPASRQRGGPEGRRTGPGRRRGNVVLQPVARPRPPSWKSPATPSPRATTPWS